MGVKTSFMYYPFVLVLYNECMCIFCIDKVYYSKLLKMLWWTFGNMLNLANALCDSLFKDICQFQRGLPFPPLDLINLSCILFRIKVRRNLKFLHRERANDFFFMPKPSSIGWGERSNTWKHCPFLGWLLGSYRITEVAQLSTLEKIYFLLI